LKIKSLLKISFLVLILVFTALGIVVLIFYRNISACYLIDYSDFKKIDKRVYISPKMPPVLIDNIISLVQNSQRRLKNFWGKMQSQPILIFCTNDTEFEIFGSKLGNIPAMVQLSPWGTYVIIKPDGANIDVIAHELCHAEFFERIGWFIKSKQVPAWFDEGLAMQIDYRYPTRDGNSYRHYLYQWQIYTRKGQKKIPLKELTHIRDFFKNGSTHTYLAYLTAGMEVSRWYEKVGQEGLFKLIRELKAGKKFKEVYLESQF
jgi:hypothetical protein